MSDENITNSNSRVSSLSGLDGCVFGVGPMGQEVVHVVRQQWLEAAFLARTDGFVVCADLTVVDYSLAKQPRVLPEGYVAERFEVVVNLRSIGERLRLRAQVPETDPHIDSLFEVFPGTNYMEREAFDMFGVVFDNHPDLARILMPADWVGHPLRKDYSIGEIPVAFKELR